MVKKQPEVTDRTRERLVDAFWSLYSTKRIDKITVREITERASCNRSTFYEYFQDVYDVLEFVENRSLPTLEQLPPLLDENESSPALLSSFITLYQHQYEIYNVLLGENGDPRFQRKLKDYLKTIFLRSISNSDQINLEKIDVMLEFLLSGMIGALMYSYQQKPHLSKQEFATYLYGAMQGDVISKLKRWMEN